jgi:hypothetical protein
VLVHAPASTVAEVFSRTSGVVTDAGEGNCLLTTGSDSLGALTFHLAAVDAEFTMLEPPELVEFVRETATRLDRAARLSAHATPRHTMAGQAATPGGRERGPG